MQDLSLMLAHESIKVTEKYYAPWVKERQSALELKMANALAAMGPRSRFLQTKLAGRFDFE
jgi:hypothetical protein